MELVTGVLGTLSMDECRFSSAVSKASVLSSRLERLHSNGSSVTNVRLDTSNSLEFVRNVSHEYVVDFHPRLVLTTTCKQTVYLQDAVLYTYIITL